MAKSNNTIEKLTELYLNENAVKEFDSIMVEYGKTKRRKSLVLRYSLTCVASLAILFVVLFSIHRKSTLQNANVPNISTIEILETINTLANIGSEEISSISAKIDGQKIIVTAEFKDGRSNKYLMRRNADGSSIEIIAQNN